MNTTITQLKRFSISFFLLLTFILVKANDKVTFALICPPDVTVDCNAELWDLSIYGNAQYHDYSGYHDAGNPVVNYNLTMCNTGTITRTWSVEDPYWNIISCTQTIYISSNGGFGYGDIQWPSNVDLTGCDPLTHPDDLGWPTWNYEDCSMVGVSYTDKLFTVTPDCKKIMRKWTVMDWCQYDPYNYNAGVFVYTQIIKIINTEPPVVNCPAEITVNASDCKNGVLVTDPLTVDASSCGGIYTITNNSPYATSSGPNISGKYPVGTTKVTYTVTYGCGTKKTCTTNVVVKNNMGPVAVCVSSLSIALMGIDNNDDGINDEGMVTLWAKDLNWKSFTSCDFGPLRYSFSSDVTEMSKVFTCDEVGKNKVKMYATDTKGNQSYCVVEIDVQNNGAHIQNCEPVDTTSHQNRKYSVHGAVKSSRSVGMPGIDLQLTYADKKYEYITHEDVQIVTTQDSFINLSGVTLYFTNFDTIKTLTIDTVELPNQVMTCKSAAEGSYNFDTCMVTTEKYKLSCADYHGEITGVDEADLEMLTSYLVGKIDFRDPSLYLAADVDGSGTINYDDLKMLIDYLSGDIENFGANNYVVYFNDEVYKTNPKSILTNAKKETLLNKIDKDYVGMDFIIAQRGNLAVNASNKRENAVTIATTDRSSNHKSDIRVYPNPTHALFFMDYTADYIGDIMINIYDGSGKLVQREARTTVMGENTFTVELQKDVKGMLLYQVVDREKVLSGKLLSIE